MVPMQDGVLLSTDIYRPVCCCFAHPTTRLRRQRLMADRAGSNIATYLPGDWPRSGAVLRWMHGELKVLGKKIRELKRAMRCDLEGACALPRKVKR